MAIAAYLSPGADLGTATDLARLSERLGYDSVWVTHGLGRDSFLVLAAYGAATSRIGLGNGVVPIYPRHPVAMAQAALTLSEITAGRFRLGVGVSHASSMEDMLGLRVVEPLAAMREYVTVLRGALGEGCDFSGRHYRARWAMAVPRRPPAPPIYLAALSAKMLELAGEIADGALLTWPTLDAPARAARDLATGARRAGRRPEDVELASIVPCAVAPDRRAALDRMRGSVAFYVGFFPRYNRLVAESGFAEAARAVKTAWDAGDHAGAAARVPDALIEAVALVGPAEACRARLLQYRDAGLALPIVTPRVDGPDALAQALATVRALAPAG
jgi:alkanesulfonate monooxygenase SsuD/methylene tetrahydromethanopterin reductase-like flavin-dependent oxidoreductase (luciferase family)